MKKPVFIKTCDFTFYFLSRTLFRKYGTSLVLLASLFITGCVATQKDMLVLKTDINKLQADIVKLQNQLTDMQKNQADLSVQMEELNINIRGLDGKIEETNERFVIFGQKLDDTNVDFTNKLSLLSEKVTKKIEETKPTPTQIYGASYTDYTMGNYDLAIGGFQDYLQQYPKGTFVANAQFWIGNCYYAKDDYANAVKNLDIVISDFPKSAKIPSAKLKKALSLLKLQNKAGAIEVFKDIVKNHSKTIEARQASNYLSKLEKKENPPVEKKEKSPLKEKESPPPVQKQK